MLAPRNGDTRFCRQWGANMAGDRLPFPIFQRSVGADLVHGPPQSLVLPSLLHQVSGLFRRSVGAGLVHEPPQGLVLSFPLHQVPGTFRRSAGTRWKVSGRRLESFRRDAGSSRTVILMQYIDPVDIYIVVLLALCTAMPQKIYSIN